MTCDDRLSAIISAARESLRERGYAVMNDFFSEDEAARLQRYARDMETLPNLITVPEKNRPDQLCRVEDMLTHHHAFRDWITVHVTNTISAVRGEPYVTFKDKTNFKWPGGGAFPPHQDYPAYSYFEPTSHVTAMLCIDPATIENGCLYVAEDWVRDCNVPNTKTILPYIEEGADNGNIVPEYCAKMEWTPLLTKPRDLVIFDSYVPHRSEKNRSNASRRAMFITHNALSEGDHRSEYYQMKRTDPMNHAFHFATPTLNDRTGATAHVSEGKILRESG